MLSNKLFHKVGSAYIFDLFSHKPIAFKGRDSLNFKKYADYITILLLDILSTKQYLCRNYEYLLKVLQILKETQISNNIKKTCQKASKRLVFRRFAKEA